jgi:hypothetical protein
MSAITFSHLTKEIELKGSESFIESNFDKIQELLIEGSAVKRKVARRTRAKRAFTLKAKVLETQTSADCGRQDLSNTSLLSPAIVTFMPHIPHEIRANRPPLRKYIRKVGFPGQEKIVVEIVEQKPKELSLAQLKEKFGLSKAKNGGITGDYLKHNRTRKVVNGGYIYAQDRVY